MNKTLRLSLLAGAMGYVGVAAADGPMALSASQLDSVTAGNDPQVESTVLWDFEANVEKDIDIDKEINVDINKDVRIYIEANSADAEAIANAQGPATFTETFTATDAVAPSHHLLGYTSSGRAVHSYVPGYSFSLSESQSVAYKDTNNHP